MARARFQIQEPVDLTSKRRIPVEQIIAIQGRSPLAEGLTAGIEGFRRGVDLGKTVRELRARRKLAKSLQERPELLGPGITPDIAESLSVTSPGSLANLLQQQAARTLREPEPTLELDEAGQIITPVGPQPVKVVETLIKAQRAKAVLQRTTRGARLSDAALNSRINALTKELQFMLSTDPRREEKLAEKSDLEAEFGRRVFGRRGAVSQTKVSTEIDVNEAIRKAKEKFNVVQVKPGGVLLGRDSRESTVGFLSRDGGNTWQRVNLLP